MATRIWRAGERYSGGEPAAGIATRHAFSFGRHYDPANVRFGLLLACNEERLAPGAGFTEHPHRDVEIVTWVIEGKLEHRDSAGHVAVVRPGEVQRLSAGAGVRHVERNAGSGPLHLVQMWLHPAELSGSTAYDVTRGSALSPLRQPESVLHVGRAELALPEAPFVYVHVVHGTVTLGGRTLGEGDAARVSGSAGTVVRPEGPAEFLVWEMHAEPTQR
jgi:redox-sensitive bicupin YhaK (pirin superfamily)